MSAPALMQWLGDHMPDVQQHVRSFSCPTDFHDFMSHLTGISGYGTHDEMCDRYLAALKVKHVARVAKKAAPQLPPEVWNTRTVDADEAMAAVRAMCGSTS